MSLEATKSAMSAETWYFGDEALKAGFCDEVIKTDKRTKAKLNREFADRYKNVPDGVEIVEEIEAEIGFIAADSIVAGELPPDEVAHEPAQEAPENDASHALPTISDNEAKDAEGAILLGNRVYRKER